MRIMSEVDGNLWFTESAANKVGSVTTTGRVSEISIPTAAAGAAGIASGPDANVWFAESGSNKIGRLNVIGSISDFNVPTANSRPEAITAGPEGNVWFTEIGTNLAPADKIGRITPAGAITEFDLGFNSRTATSNLLGSPRVLMATCGSPNSMRAVSGVSHPAELSQSFRF